VDSNRYARCAGANWPRFQKSKVFYLILRPDRCPPHFLYMKDSIRTSDLEELQAQWVEGSRILYIGKAGGSDIAEKLPDRLKRYFRYGEGHRGSGHAGGKRIWELTNSAELIACWKTTPRPCLTDQESADI